MKCKERKSKQCAKLVQILINLSILNYYIMVLVRTCTVSSVGAVRRGNRPATSVSISWLYRCLLLLSRILCSVIFQKEGGNLPNISWPHSVFSTPFDRAEIWCRAPRDHWEFFHQLFTSYTLLIKHRRSKINYLLQDVRKLCWNVIWDAEETGFLVFYHSWLA